MFLTKDNKIKWGSLVIGTFVAVGLVLTGVFWFDLPVFNFLHRHFDWTFLEGFSKIFDIKNWLVLSVLIMLVFYIKKSLDVRPKVGFSDFYEKVKNSYAFYVFCSVLCAGVVGAVLKFVIGRGRPTMPLHGPLDYTPFTNLWEFNSMPSGHTLASFAALVVIGLLAPRVRWLTWTLAIFIGVSRVCIGLHWPSDVILGAFIGMVSADIVKSIFAHRAK